MRTRASIGCAAAGVLLGVLMLFAGCARPIRDPRELAAIRTEAQRLMAARADRSPRVGIPEDRWPPAIARLRPRAVGVSRSNVDILMRTDFDGGWGYEVPRTRHGLPMPPTCYSEPYPGVFWHDPC